MLLQLNDLVGQPVVKGLWRYSLPVSGNRHMTGKHVCMDVADAGDRVGGWRRMCDAHSLRDMEIFRRKDRNLYTEYHICLRAKYGFYSCAPQKCWNRCWIPPPLEKRVGRFCNGYRSRVLAQGTLQRQYPSVISQVCGHKGAMQW